MGGGGIFEALGLIALAIMLGTGGFLFLTRPRVTNAEARKRLFPSQAMFGDLPAVPAEALSRSAKLSGAGRSEEKADRLVTQGRHSQSAARGAK
jgi:hypothetical protein